MRRQPQLPVQPTGQRPVQQPSQSSGQQPVSPSGQPPVQSRGQRSAGVPGRQSGQQTPALDCRFCGYRVPSDVSPVGGRDQTFCSEPCREAFEAGQEPFAGDLDFKRRSVGVAALQPGLPEGIPGNAAVLVAGEEGTRREELLVEWVWRALQRGETAVMVSVDEPPSVFVDTFLAHGWNVLPYLHQRDLVLVDMFTTRLEDEEAFTKRNDRWNSFVGEAFDRGFVGVRDPSDLRTVSNQLDDTLEELETTDSGVVAVNSLTELASFTQEVQAVNFLKEIRAIVCKSRYVPLLAGASVPRRDDLYQTDYPHDHEYLFDGIVDLELDDDGADGERVDRLSVRKMESAPVVSDWIRYQFQPGVGHVPLWPPAGKLENGEPAAPAPGRTGASTLASQSPPAATELGVPERGYSEPANQHSPGPAGQQSTDPAGRQ